MIQNYAHIIISIIQIMNIHVSIIDIHIRARTLDAARPSDGPFVLYDIQQSPDVSSVRV